MKAKNGQLWGVIILAFSIMSCNLTSTVAAQPTPTEIIPPTPVYTSTSIYPPTFAPPAFVLTSTLSRQQKQRLPPHPTLDLPTATSTSTLVPYIRMPLQHLHPPSSGIIHPLLMLLFATPTDRLRSSPSVNTKAINLLHPLMTIEVNGQMLKYRGICGVW